MNIIVILKLKKEHYGIGLSGESLLVVAVNKLVTTI